MNKASGVRIYFCFMKKILLSSPAARSATVFSSGEEPKQATISPRNDAPGQLTVFALVTNTSARVYSWPEERVTTTTQLPVGKLDVGDLEQRIALI